MTLLEKTYSHINRVTLHREESLWKEGVLDWESTLDNINYYAMPRSMRETFKKELPRSIRHYNNKNYTYFLERLEKFHKYRVYPFLEHKTLFLDIETTGVKPSDDHITVIGCYDGSEVRVFVYGENEYEFLDYIKKFSIVVTFNGSCFDMPFLEKYFDTEFDIHQIDLRFLLKDLGYTGGLKKIEEATGLNRGDDMTGVNGYTAVLLWKHYKSTNDKRALDTLIHYNLLDTINLEYLLRMAYNQYAKKFGANQIKPKTLPKIEYKCYKEIINYIQKHRYKYF